MGRDGEGGGTEVNHCWYTGYKTSNYPLLPQHTHSHNSHLPLLQPLHPCLPHSLSHHLSPLNPPFLTCPPHGILLPPLALALTFQMNLMYTEKRLHQLLKPSTFLTSNDNILLNSFTHTTLSLPHTLTFSTSSLHCFFTSSSSFSLSLLAYSAAERFSDSSLWDITALPLTPVQSNHTTSQQQ